MSWFSNLFGSKKNVQSNASLRPQVTAPTAAAMLYGNEVIKQTVIILIVLFGVFLLTLFIMYIVMKVKSSKLKEVVLQDNILALNNPREIPFKAESNKMDLSVPGQEFSISFWIYLNPRYESTANHKLLISRGVLPDTPNGNIDYNSNPVIFLDKNTNKMYFALSTNQVTSTNISLDDVIAQDVQGRYVNGFLVTYIDYVPLQRWVNITLTIKDNSAYVFMDADMYSAMTVNDNLISKSNRRPIIRGTNGDLVIGSRSSSASGYIIYTSYYNYALTQTDIQNIYARGPYPKTLLSLVGLGQFGVRWPIYKIE